MKTFLLEMAEVVEKDKSLDKYKHLNEKTKCLALDYINCASRDLRDSRLLQEKDDIPISIYHLQQGIEKLAKANALSSMPLNECEIREISQQSPEIFLRLMRKKLFQESLLAFKNYQPELDLSKMDSLNDLIDNMKNLMLKRK